MKILIVLVLTAAAVYGQVGSCINSHDGNYTLVAADMGCKVTSATTGTYTVPRAGIPGFEFHKSVILANTAADASGVVLTVALSVGVLNGNPFSNLSAAVLAPGQSLLISSDAPNWLVLSYSLGGAGGGGGPTPPAVNNVIAGNGVGGFSDTGILPVLLTKKYIVTSPPTSGSTAGNLAGDRATDSTNHVDYVCMAPFGTAAPACPSVSVGGWTASAGAGTVTSFSAGTLSPLFTTSVGTGTTTPALSFILTNAAQNSVFGGPDSGGAGAPSYKTAPVFSAANLTNFPTLNQNTTGNAAGLTTYPTICSGGQFSQGLSSGSNNCGTPSGSGATSTSQLTDFTLSISGTTLTIQAGEMEFENAHCSIATATATISTSTASGSAKVFIADTCALTFEYTSSASITWGSLSGVTASTATVPTVPDTAKYLGDVTFATGSTGFTGHTGARAVITKQSVSGGTGIQTDPTTGTTLVSADPAVLYFLGGTNAITGTHDASAATTTKPNRVVSSDPSGSCSTANEVILSTASDSLWNCHTNWHQMGGSGGSASEYLTTSNTNVLTTGTGDTIIAATTAALPALAAGACRAFDAWVLDNQNAVITAVKVWFGTGMTIASDYSAGDSLDLEFSALNPKSLRIQGQICNNAGVQNAQTSIGNIVARGSATGLSYTTGGSGTMAQTTTATNLQVGISIASNQIFATVVSFRTWLVQ